MSSFIPFLESETQFSHEDVVRARTMVTLIKLLCDKCENRYFRLFTDYGEFK